MKIVAIIFAYCWNTNAIKTLEVEICDKHPLNEEFSLLFLMRTKFLKLHGLPMFIKAMFLHIYLMLTLVKQEHCCSSQRSVNSIT